MVYIIPLSVRIYSFFFVIYGEFVFTECLREIMS